MNAIKRKYFIVFQEEKEDLNENVSDTLAKIIRMRFNGQNSIWKYDNLKR